MRRPWNPWSLVVVTFFGGPLGGGWLLARNFTRLGERHKETWCLLAFLALTLLLSLGFVWWSQLGPGAGPSETSSALPRLGARAVSTLAAVVVASLQSRRYQVFERSGGKPGKLLGVAIAAIVVGGLIHVGIILGLLALLAP